VAAAASAAVRGAGGAAALARGRAGFPGPHPEDRELALQVAAPALGTLDLRSHGLHEHFEFSLATVAMVFIDRHGEILSLKNENEMGAVRLKILITNNTNGRMARISYSFFDSCHSFIRAIRDFHIRA
jgi:hypothetical protein